MKGMIFVLRNWQMQWKIHKFVPEMTMMMKSFAPISAVLCLMAAACTPRGGYITVTGYAQGGTYSVKMDMDGPDGRIRMRPEQIKEGIDSVLEEINNSVSGYNKGSILSRFNNGERVMPDGIFRDLYEISYGFYNETGGSFDVSAAPLFDIWGFGFTSDSLPSPEKVRAVLSSVGMNRLKDTLALDSEGYTSGRLLLLPQLSSGDLSASCAGGVDADPALPKLNFNAIAQGYSCDLVADYLHSIGADKMLVDVGGEIYCEGLNASGRPWGIGLDRPVDGNDTPGRDLQGIFRAGPEPCGVVTSGNYRKFYIRDGRKYAHTIDPRTGYPVTHSLLSATVIADDATEADALATYCMVIGLEESKAFISSRPDLEACLVYEEDGLLRTWTSSGLVFEPL